MPEHSSSGQGGMNIIAKGGTSKVKVDDLIKFFNSTDDVDAIKQKVEDSDDRVFLSWDTVEVIDKDSEIIPVDQKLKKFYNIYVNERDGPISDTHTNRIIGKTLAFKVMPRADMNNTMGVLTLNKIHDHYDLDDKIWEGIKNGSKPGVSVGGGAKDKTLFQTGDGTLGKVLNMNGLWEKAVVDEPANYAANIEAYAFAKGNALKKATSPNTEEDSVVRNKNSNLEGKSASSNVDKTTLTITESSALPGKKIIDAELNDGSHQLAIVDKNSPSSKNKTGGNKMADVNKDGVYASVDDLQSLAQRLAAIEQKMSQPAPAAPMQKDDSSDADGDSDVAAGKKKVAKDDSSDSDSDDVSASAKNKYVGQTGESQPVGQVDGQKVYPVTLPKTISEKEQDLNHGTNGSAVGDKVNFYQKVAEEAVMKAMKANGLVSETPRPVNKADRSSPSTHGPETMDAYQEFIVKMHKGEKPRALTMGDVHRAERARFESELERVFGKKV